MACRVGLPLRLPYQFLPLLLLALSGRKAEKSERKGFVIALMVVSLAISLITEDQSCLILSLLAKTIFFFFLAALFSELGFN